MKVLMLGWEFPPYLAGGVGVVCEAMTKALARRGAEITYLMPRAPARDDEPGVRIRSLTTPGRPIEVVTLPSVLVSYAIDKEVVPLMLQAGRELSSRLGFDEG